MQHMNLSDPNSGMRWRNAAPGTKVPIRTLRDLTPGATLVCTSGFGDMVKGREYTVVSVSPTRVDMVYRGRKLNVKPENLVARVERRVGPVVEESLQKGLTAIATVDGRTYCAGLQFTLTEASGRVFSFITDGNGKGSIERSELFMACIYA